MFNKWNYKFDKNKKKEVDNKINTFDFCVKVQIEHTHLTSFPFKTTLKYNRILDILLKISQERKAE